MCTLTGFYLFSWSYSDSSTAPFEVGTFWLSWVSRLIFSLRWLGTATSYKPLKFFWENTTFRRLLSSLFCRSTLHLLYMVFVLVFYTSSLLSFFPLKLVVLVLVSISFDWLMVRLSVCGIDPIAMGSLASKFCPTSFHPMHTLLSVVFCAIISQEPSSFPGIACTVLLYTTLLH